MEITMNYKPVALVTGANKGIGFQIAKDLVAQGFTVLIGSRNLANGEAAASQIGENAIAIQLDVTDHASVTTAAQRVTSDFGRLDVLVNNAGISNAGHSDSTFEEVVQSGFVTVASLDETRAIFETNVFGVIAVTQAMLPLLRESPAGRIVNVSSSLGSLARTSDPSNAYGALYGIYSASKTALNAVTLKFALELKSTPIKVNAACPGYTSTDLNKFQGTRTVEEGAREPVRLALLGPDGPTGTFSDEEGPIAW
jgi:NAD(P)-dependent dehydrogenase (short-subunit alcohol dehydrogenase family)